jgi:hypothetical protein
MIRIIPFALLLPTATALAQSEVDAVTWAGPQFAIAVIAGVVIALGFQLLLTNLSVATGITAMGAIEPPRDANRTDANRANAEPNRVPQHGANRLPAHGANRVHEDHGVHGTVRTVTSALGIWTILTACIALFFGSWLAVELAVTHALVIGAVLGLVIWGLFYLVVTAFEFTAFNSLVGMVGRTAAAGLDVVRTRTASLFGLTERKEAVATATDVARAVADELAQQFDVNRLRKDLSEYVERLAPKPIDPARIRTELAKLLNDLQLQAVQVDDPYAYDHEITARLRARNFDETTTRNVAEGVFSVLQIL